MSLLRRWVVWMLLTSAITVGAGEPGPSPEELQRRIQALEAQMKTMMEAYRSQISDMKSQIDALLAAQGSAPSSPAPPERAGGPPPNAPAAPPAANAMNPAISVIPDLTFSSGDDPRWKALDAFSLREVEVAFSASIDPYAQAVVALAAHRHAHALELGERFGHAHDDGGGEEAHGYEIDVEEGYALFPAVPGGFTLKVGKFYADFGKENALHTHSWALADRPWALQAVLGGEGHGLSDVGVSLSRLLPLPWASELTLEATGGRSEGTFDGGRSDLAYLASWRNYWDFTESTNLELQLSYMVGKNASGRTTRLGNASVTFRHRPVAPRWNSVLWRTEYLQKRYGTYGEERYHDGGPDAGEGAPRPVTLTTEGLFSYVDWQFTRGWSLGARADWVRFPHEGMADRGGTLAVTYYPSEFQRFRLQVQRYSYAGLGTRDAVVLEYGFSIGPHGAHPF